MQSTLEELVGPEAKSFSTSTISRFKQVWGEEYKAWCQAPLDKVVWVYIWVDDIHSGLRSDNSKLCALTVIGVNE